MLSEAGRRQRPHIAGGVTTPYPPSRVSACQVIQFAVIDGVHDGLVWPRGENGAVGDILSHARHDCNSICMKHLHNGYAKLFAHTYARAFALLGCTVQTAGTALRRPPALGSFPTEEKQGERWR